MTGIPAQRQPGPVITEDWGGLAEYACKLRADWDEIEWLGVAGACRDAQVPFRAAHREVMRLAWDTGTSHDDALTELCNFARDHAQQHARKGEAPASGVMEALRAGNFTAVRAAFKTTSVVPRRDTTPTASTQGEQL